MIFFEKMEFELSVIIGMIGSMIAGFFGGWSTSLNTLCILMLIDYITGVLLALVFKKSEKTNSGAYSSTVGFKGILKKGMILLTILICHRIDLEIGSNYVRDSASIAFIVNELISLAENMNLMGVPFPDIIVRAIDILKSKGEIKEEENEDGR